MYEAYPRAGVNRVYTKRREGRLSWERWKVVPVWAAVVLWVVDGDCSDAGNGMESCEG